MRFTEFIKLAEGDGHITVVLRTLEDEFAELYDKAKQEGKLPALDSTTSGNIWTKTEMLRDNISRLKAALKEANGIETWPVSNMLGHVKKFRKIDGWWEKPSEVASWMKNREIPQPKLRSSAQLERARAKYPNTDPKTALQWHKADEEEEKQQRYDDKHAAARKKASMPNAEQIVAAGEDAIGQSFPDGDPSDYLRDYLDKYDLDWSDINAAFKKVHRKEFYPYLADLWDSHAGDALEDAKQGTYGEHYDDQWFSQRNPWR